MFSLLWTTCITVIMMTCFDNTLIFSGGGVYAVSPHIHPPHQPQDSTLKHYNALKRKISKEGLYVVQLKKQLTQQQVDEYFDRLRQNEDVEIRHIYKSVLRGYSARFHTMQAINRERNNPNVKLVELVQPIRPADFISGCGKQVETTNWNLAHISTDDTTKPMSSVFKYPEEAGKEVIAYVLDSGCRTTHEEFKGPNGVRAFNDAEFLGGDGTGNTSPAQNNDDYGHGTHVSSTIIGKTVGVARLARVYMIKVLDSTGVGYNSDFIAALEHIYSQIKNTGAQNRRFVINMSITGGYSQAVNNAIQALPNELNVAVFVAAGNDGKDVSDFSPASAPSIFTVCALDYQVVRKRDENDNSVTIEGAYSPSLAAYSNHGSLVDICAPGTNINGAWHTGDDAYYMSTGTSMASPHVAGVAALYISARVVSSPDSSAIYNSLHRYSAVQTLNLSRCPPQICPITPTKLLSIGCPQ